MACTSRDAFLQCNYEMANVHDPYGVSIRKGWCNCWTCTKKLHDCVHNFCNWVALSAVK